MQPSSEGVFGGGPPGLRSRSALRADSPALLDEAGGQRGPTQGTRWPTSPASPALLGAFEGLAGRHRIRPATCLAVPTRSARSWRPCHSAGGSRRARPLRRRSAWRAGAGGGDLRGGEQRRTEVGARQRASFLTRGHLFERSGRSPRSEFGRATSGRAAQRSRRQAPTARQEPPPAPARHAARTTSSPSAPAVPPSPARPRTSAARTSCSPRRSCRPSAGRSGRAGP